MVRILEYVKKKISPDMIPSESKHLIFSIKSLKIDDRYAANPEGIVDIDRAFLEIISGLNSARNADKGKNFFLFF